MIFKDCRGKRNGMLWHGFFFIPVRSPFNHRLGNPLKFSNRNAGLCSRPKAFLSRFLCSTCWRERNAFICPALVLWFFLLPFINIIYARLNVSWNMLQRDAIYYVVLVLLLFFFPHHPAWAATKHLFRVNRNHKEIHFPSAWKESCHGEIALKWRQKSTKTSIKSSQATQRASLKEKTSPSQATNTLNLNFIAMIKFPSRRSLSLCLMENFMMTHKYDKSSSTKRSTATHERGSLCYKL